MKFINAFFIIWLSLFIFGCSNQQNEGSGDLSKKMLQLDKRIDSLEAQLENQKTKTRISFMEISSNPLFNTPLEDFLFASDDYWNNTVDVGLYECRKRCVKAAEQRRKICEAMPDGKEKTKCYNDSQISASSCQNNCSKNFPIKLNNIP